MSGENLLGRHLTGFFAEYLVGERAASPRTVESYRDAFKALLSFFEGELGIRPERVELSDLNGDSVRSFLAWLEESRGCCASTRNHRLAAVKSFCRYAAGRAPDCLGPLSSVLDIREKSTPARAMGYLEADEVRRLLAQPGSATRIAFRDTVMMSLLYDTGARVQELCDINVGDVRASAPMVIVLHGKGGKDRSVPVMEPTAGLVERLIAEGPANPGIARRDEPLFRSSRGGRLTRWGVANAISKNVEAIRAEDASFACGLKITPHTLRHSRAMHLLQAGVNLIYIRDLLGHVDVSTTEIYARADTEMKRKAIEGAYEPLAPELRYPDWTDDKSLMGWLGSLGKRD